jgi:hypothetical protein
MHKHVLCAALLPEPGAAAVAVAGGGQGQGPGLGWSASSLMMWQVYHQDFVLLMALMLWLNG